MLVNPQEDAWRIWVRSLYGDGGVEAVVLEQQIRKPQNRQPCKMCVGRSDPRHQLPSPFVTSDLWKASGP
ncbi:hypothetical protein PRBEI_2001437700 [Prionailurus iriomotensis]